MTRHQRPSRDQSVSQDKKTTRWLQCQVTMLLWWPRGGRGWSKPLRPPVTLFLLNKILLLGAVFTFFDFIYVQLRQRKGRLITLICFTRIHHLGLLFCKNLFLVTCWCDESRSHRTRSIKQLLLLLLKLQPLSSHLLPVSGYQLYCLAQRREEVTTEWNHQPLTSLTSVTSVTSRFQREKADMKLTTKVKDDGVKQQI